VSEGKGGEEPVLAAECLKGFRLEAPSSFYTALSAGGSMSPGVTSCRLHGPHLFKVEPLFKETHSMSSGGLVTAVERVRRDE